MDVTQTSAAPPPAARSAAGAANPRISSDFDTFLKMLTVQMQNQDPLNPIDSADYAVQLATFSGVEQQTRTNQLLENVMGQFGVLGMAQLAGWVGNEARAGGPVQFEGRAVTLFAEPASLADRAMLVVRDGAGQLVSREDVWPVDGQMTWVGRDMTGNALPQGPYTLSLESFAGTQLLGSNPVEAYRRIIEVQGGAQGTRLILTGGVEVAATEVTALRTPPG
jgi:flagellar basal-body rod modification protein FlgD